MELLKTLESCVRQGQRAELLYRDSGGILSNRKIDPLALIFTNGQWLLIAYCHLRKEDRQFKLERMASLKVLEEHFAPRTEVLYRFYNKN